MPNTRPPHQRVSTRPLYQRPAMLALVFLGGAAGTFARWLTGHLLGDPARFPHGTLTVNLVGAFLLGLLLAFLESRGPEVPRRRDIRLLCGTGFMGGFTTYSAFAVQQALLLGAAGTAGGVAFSAAGGAGAANGVDVFDLYRVLPVVLYGGVSLAGGLALAVLGMTAGSLLGAALGRRECRRWLAGGQLCPGDQCTGGHCLRGQRGEEPGHGTPSDDGSREGGAHDG